MKIYKCDIPILSLILIYVEIRYKNKEFKIIKKVKYYGRRK